MIIFCSYWWSVSNLYNSKRSKLKAIIQILWDSELLIYLKQLLITSMNFIEFFRMRAVLKPEIVAKTQHALQPLNSQLRGLSHTSGLPESQNIRTCLTFQCIWRRAFLEAIGLVRNGRVSVWALIQHHRCQPRCKQCWVTLQSFQSLAQQLLGHLFSRKTTSNWASLHWVI